jgi:hypothetical protein
MFNRRQRPNMLDVQYFQSPVQWQPARFQRSARAFWLLALALAPWTAEAHTQASRASSEASALAVGSVVAAPLFLLSAGGALTVLSVQTSAEGAVWVVERASDGARAVVRFAGHASAASGEAVVVSAMASGWMLLQAGRVVAFVPNALGQGLLHHEKVAP